MSGKLVDYELQVLRCVNGADVPGLKWGAAMGEAVEYLRGAGYLSKSRVDGGTKYTITDKGRAALTREKT